MHLLVRNDASIGLGHTMRCKALAEAWPGEVTWQLDSSEKLPAGTWCVFDGYSFQPNDFAQAKQAGYRVLVIDDNAHLSRYDCDILVNQDAHAKSLKYKTNKDCKQLLGPMYALIRCEFQEWRDRREEHETKRVLVALGSAATDATSMMLKRVLGEIECESRWAEGQAHLPSLMAWADVGIIAAGVMSLEACYMGLPTILLTTADNQFGNGQALDGDGCGYHLGAAERITKRELHSAVGWLLWDKEAWQTMRERQMALVDGKGPERVVEAMCEHIHPGD